SSWARCWRATLQRQITGCAVLVEYPHPWTSSRLGRRSNQCSPSPTPPNPYFARAWPSLGRCYARDIVESRFNRGRAHLHSQTDSVADIDVLRRRRGALTIPSLIMLSPMSTTMVSRSRGFHFRLERAGSLEAFWRFPSSGMISAAV